MKYRNWLVVHTLKYEGCSLILVIDSVSPKPASGGNLFLIAPFPDLCLLEPFCTRAKRLGNYRGVLCDIEITQQF